MSEGRLGDVNHSTDRGDVRGGITAGRTYVGDIKAGRRTWGYNGRADVRGGYKGRGVYVGDITAGGTYVGV